MATRKVFMLGQTGAGKSIIGNYLLSNELAFKEADIGSNESETTTVSSSSSNLPMGLALTVFDTPGLGDTKGRSIQFLDNMMTKIIKERPHGLVFVLNAGSKFGPEIKLALLCFAQCLKTSVDSEIGLPHGRVLLLVNHLPADAAFEGGMGSKRVSPQEKEDTLALAVDNSNALLSECLKLPLEQKLPFGHVFGVQKGDANIKSKMENIWSAIATLPEDPLDVNQFRSFRDVMMEATQLKDNAVSADVFAERKVKQLQYDIDWHRSRIRDCTTAHVATAWIPFANIATSIGFGAAIADSQSKIPGLEQERKTVTKDKEGKLAKAKEKAEKWLDEMTTLKSVMEKK